MLRQAKDVRAGEYAKVPKSADPRASGEPGVGELVMRTLDKAFGEIDEVVCRAKELRAWVEDAGSCICRFS
jgi:hypothetical protein